MFESSLRPTKLGFVAFKQHVAACFEDAKMLSLFLPFLLSVDSPDDRQKRLLETMASKDIDNGS